MNMVLKISQLLRESLIKEMDSNTHDELSILTREALVRFEMMLKESYTTKGLSALLDDDFSFYAKDIIKPSDFNNLGNFLSKAFLIFKFHMEHNPSKVGDMVDASVKNYKHYTINIYLDKPSMDCIADYIEEGSILSCLDNLETTLIHELQHAFDSFRSNSKVGSELKNKQIDPNDHNQYLNLKHEVNARFSETINSLNKQLNNGTLEVNYKAIFTRFKEEFEGWKVMKPLTKKRLLNRVYQYYSS